MRIDFGDAEKIKARVLAMVEGQRSRDVLKVWAHRTGKLPPQPWGERTPAELLEEFYLDLALELRGLQRGDGGEPKQETLDRIATLEKFFYGKSGAEDDREWLDEMISKLEAELGEGADREVEWKLDDLGAARG